MGRGAAGNVIFAALHPRVAPRAAGEPFGRRFLQPCAKRQSFLALAVKKYENAESQRHCQNLNDGFCARTRHAEL